MCTILMTGFEPFGGESVNASWEAVRLLDGVRFEDCAIRSMKLPTAFGEADDAILMEIGASRPDAVIMVGQSARRRVISLERRAVNRAHASIDDNAGRRPLDARVREGAREIYASTLPIAAIARRLRNAGILVEISSSAGTFVCNSAFFSVGHWRKTADPSLMAGFVHVPVTPEQAAKLPAETPSMPLDRIVDGLRLAAAATAEALRRKRPGPPSWPDSSPPSASRR